jgi:hypothetical protein
MITTSPKQKAWKKYYDKNKDRLNKKKCEYQKKRYVSLSLDIKIKTAIRREKLKKEVMTHYGGGKAECVICGMNNIDALCLDHKDDNGSADRFKNMGKNLGGSGSRFYGFLKKHNFPDGYQTLCANHNLIKEIERKRKLRGY